MCTDHVIGDQAAQPEKVYLMGEDGSFLRAAMMHPGVFNEVEVVTCKVKGTFAALRFCTAEKATATAALLNGHEGPGYWRVVRI